MKAVLQRVSEASVRVDDAEVGRIGRGYCVLLGVAQDDTFTDAETLCRKVVGLRLFADDDGRMNRSLTDVDGALLVVSQFTLQADCRRGQRPSFTAAAPRAHAERLYEHFIATAKPTVPVETGRFGADMALSLLNDGPVTILLDTREPV